MKSRIILIFQVVFVLLICGSVIPTECDAQCSGTFKIVATYNSNGDKITTDNAFPRIMVVSTNFFGVRQASLSTWNPMLNMWNTASMDFQYAGYNNGWYIYRCDVFMMGTNFLYLHEDGDCVRLKYSFMDGKYNEYVPYKSGEDVDRGPTY